MDRTSVEKQQPGGRDNDIASEKQDSVEKESEPENAEMRSTLKGLTGKVSWADIVRDTATTGGGSAATEKKPNNKKQKFSFESSFSQNNPDVKD